MRSISVHEFDKTCDPISGLKEATTFGNAVFTDNEECIRHTWLSIESKKETPWKRELFVG